MSQATLTGTQGTITPKWLLKQCGATFGFGGKLVRFNSNYPSFDIVPFSSETQLLQMFDSFDKSHNEKNIDLAIEEYIHKAGKNEYELLEWTAMKCLIQKSNDPLLDALGINLDKISTETDKITGRKKKKINEKQPIKSSIKPEAAKLDADQAINFFEALNDNAKQKQAHQEESREEEMPFGSQQI